MTKDVIEAIVERRCIRNFKDEGVMQATLGRIIESATYAPSAGNLQPWHFFVVQDDQAKREISLACFGQHFIEQAPAVIVVCAIPGISEAEYGSRGSQLYCIQDTAAAVQNMLLTCTAYGLGSCWVSAFDENILSQAVGASPEMRPVAVVPVGYSAEEPNGDEMRPVEQVCTVIR